MQITFIHLAVIVTEVLYMSTSYQPGRRVNFEKPILFFDLTAKAVKSENKKDFSKSEKAALAAG